MSDEWEFYFTDINDVLASVFVNLGLHEAVPDPKRPWLLWTWLYFRQPRDDGLSSSDEAPTLNEIEDHLTESVKRTLDADLVGRITTAGRREIYFYGLRPDGFEEAVTDAMCDFRDYEFDAGFKEDAEWSQYLDVLYPSPEDLQRIKNLHVVETLEKHGDNLQSPRPVWHWAYFNVPDERSKFVDKARELGFKVTSEIDSDDPAPERAYGVTLERIDFVDWNSINEITLKLFRLAIEHGGNYDGWETSVEKES